MWFLGQQFAPLYYYYCNRIVTVWGDKYVVVVVRLSLVRRRRRRLLPLQNVRNFEKRKKCLDRASSIRSSAALTLDWKSWKKLFRSQKNFNEEGRHGRSVGRWRQLWRSPSPCRSWSAGVPALPPTSLPSCFPPWTRATFSGVSRRYSPFDFRRRSNKIYARIFLRNWQIFLRDKNK